MGVAKRHAHMIYEDEDGKRRVAETSATRSKPFAKMSVGKRPVATVRVLSPSQRPFLPDSRRSRGDS